METSQITENRRQNTFTQILKKRNIWRYGYLIASLGEEFDCGERLDLDVL